ncbi:T9SS type A sorting domain-containing protein, partial [uncultured Winogradskyella sp.]|uniref:T9SS type A sorting domain-containing protein n=2 Tax=Winogradskyella TaxID=286104 RepID=UPI0030D858C2
SNYGSPAFVGFAEVAFSGTPSALGVSDFTLSDAISLYPNPATDVIKIKNISDLKLEGIRIYDINGRLVAHHKVRDTSNNQSINVSELASGIYMLQIYSNQANTIKRIIKN